MSAVAVGGEEGKPPTQPSKQARGEEPGEMEARPVDHKHEVPGSEERSGHQWFDAAISTAHNTVSGTQESSAHRLQCWHFTSIATAPMFHPYSWSLQGVVG